MNGSDEFTRGPVRPAKLPGSGHRDTHGVSVTPIDLEAIQSRADRVANFTITGFGIGAQLEAAEIAIDSAEDVPALLQRIRELEAIVSAPASDNSQEDKK